METQAELGDLAISPLQDVPRIRADEKGCFIASLWLTAEVADLLALLPHLNFPSH